MIITCPNCAARFNLKDDLLGDKGRNVKCAKCSHRWFAERPVDAANPAAPKPLEEAAAPPPPPPPPAPPRPAAPPPEQAAPVEPDKPDEPDEDDADGDNAYRRPPPIPSEEEIARFQSRPPVKPRSLLPWWIALFVTIVALVGSSIYFSKAIVSAYPAANKLFSLIGLPVNTLGYGLEIAKPTTSQREEGNDRIIVVSGEISNTTSQVMDVPLLRGELKDAQGETLFIWSFKANEPRVLAGEKNTYETEIRNPPPGATELNISFTREEEIAAEREQAREAARRPDADR
ncbi:MAG: zinc-ribbon domain-containing protein [Alphaproteobacteria bacterium]